MSSSGLVCRCTLTFEQDGRVWSRVPDATWRVVYRECHHSVFGGGHYQPSRFSMLICLKCKATWRTKQTYVASVPDVKEGEWP